MGERILELFHIRRQLDKPAPSSGAAGYFYQVFTFFWRFVTLNLLFLLFSLPIVTLPAALSAVNRVCIKLIRNGNVLAWAEFRDEFKASFSKGLRMGLFFAAWAFAAYYLLSLGLTNWENQFGVMFTALGTIVLVVLAVWAAYAFVLLACLDLPVRHLLSNARALTFLAGKRTLAVLGVLLCTVGLLVLLFPFSLIPFLLGGIALVQYTICRLVNVPMQRWIIAPYEQQSAT